MSNLKSNINSFINEAINNIEDAHDTESIEIQDLFKE